MDSQPDRTQSIEQQLQEQLLAGVQGTQKQQGKIRDQLREMFNPDDYVTVVNPFDHITGWAYVDPAEERQERPDKTTKRVHFGLPKTRILQPGEKVVIHGWEAYIALGRMFKEYAQKQGSSMTIVLTSQKEIDSFLSRACLGKFDPNAHLNALNADTATRDIEANAQPAPAPVADPLGFGAPTQPVQAPQTQEQHQAAAAQQMATEDATQANTHYEVPAREVISEEELLAQGVSQEEIDRQVAEHSDETAEIVQ